MLNNDSLGAAYEKGYASGKFNAPQSEHMNPYAWGPQYAAWQHGYDDATAEPVPLRNPNLIIKEMPVLKTQWNPSRPVVTPTPIDPPEVKLLKYIKQTFPHVNITLQIHRPHYNAEPRVIAFVRNDTGGVFATVACTEKLASDEACWRWIDDHASLQEKAK